MVAMLYWISGRALSSDLIATRPNKAHGYLPRIFSEIGKNSCLKGYVTPWHFAGQFLAVSGVLPLITIVIVLGWVVGGLRIERFRRVGFGVGAVWEDCWRVHCGACWLHIAVTKCNRSSATWKIENLYRAATMWWSRLSERCLLHRNWTILYMHLHRLQAIWRRLLWGEQ